MRRGIGRGWLAMMLFVVGCGGAATTQPPETVVVPPAGVTADAHEADEGATPGPEPHAKQERLTTVDGLISVTVPGDGWTCSEDSFHADATSATWVRCHLTASDPEVWLMAKDYTVADEGLQKAPKRLFEDHYDKNYHRMFDSHRYLSQEEVRHQSRPGFEVLLAANASGTAIQLRERAVVEGVHVALVTAHWPEAEGERVQPAVDSWFASVRFESLDNPRDMAQAQERWQL